MRGRNEEIMIDRLLHTPEGVRDIYNAEYAKKLKLEKQLHEVMCLYGFRDIQTPTFEYYEIFKKERGTVAPQKMYRFFDREGNTLVLRPDMTPSIARCVSKYFKEEILPIRLCYRGNTFINSNEYQGKLKENTQFGAELIQDGSVEADAEILALTIDCLKNAGLSDFQVEVGQVEFFHALVEEASFEEGEVFALREMIENKNALGMEELLKEKQLSVSLREILLCLPELFGSIERVSAVKAMTKNEKALRALLRLEELYDLMKAYGLAKYISFDLGMLGTYGYYTGIIFQAYTYGTGDRIVSGGRYDSLLSQFGKSAPAVGMALFVDELMNALIRQKKDVPVLPSNYLILYEPKEKKQAIAALKQLRTEGKKVEAMCEEGIYQDSVYLTYARRHGIRTICRFGKDGNLCCQTVQGEVEENQG